MCCVYKYIGQIYANQTFLHFFICCTKFKSKDRGVEAFDLTYLHQFYSNVNDLEEQLNRDSIKVDYFEWDLLYHFSSHFFVNHFLERIIGLYFIVAVETEIEQTKRNNVAAVAVGIM